MNEDSPVPSPCVDVCVVMVDGTHCLGCYRTLDEIAGWSSYSNKRKRAVLDECEARMEAAFED